MFKPINRDIIILFPKQPLMDWVNYIYPEDKHECPKALRHDQVRALINNDFGTKATEIKNM